MDNRFIFIPEHLQNDFQSLFSLLAKALYPTQDPFTKKFSVVTMEDIITEFNKILTKQNFPTILLMKNVNLFFPELKNVNNSSNQYPYSSNNLPSYVNTINISNTINPTTYIYHNNPNGNPKGNPNSAPKLNQSNQLTKTPLPNQQTNGKF